jgi:hypothetical protein
MRDWDFSATPLDSIGPSPTQRKIIGNHVASHSGAPGWGPNLETAHAALRSPLSYQTALNLMTRSYERGQRASTFLGGGFDVFWKTSFLTNGLGTGLGILLDDSGHLYNFYSIGP